MYDTVLFPAPQTKSESLRDFIQANLVRFVLQTPIFPLIVAVVSQIALKLHAGKGRVELHQEWLAVPVVFPFLGSFQPPRAQHGVPVLLGLPAPLTVIFPVVGQTSLWAVPAVQAGGLEVVRGRVSLPDWQTLGALVSVHWVPLASLAQSGVLEEIDKGRGLLKFIKLCNLYPLVAAVALQVATGYDGLVNKVLVVDHGEGPSFESLVSEWNIFWFIRSQGKPRMESVLYLLLSFHSSNWWWTHTTLGIFWKSFQMFRKKWVFLAATRINYFYFLPELL